MIRYIHYIINQSLENEEYEEDDYIQEDGEINIYELLMHLINLKIENDILNINSITEEMDETLLSILNIEKIDYNLKDNNGFTILMCSILEKTKKSTFKLLNKKEIDYNSVNSDGDTALILACKNKKKLNMNFISIFN